MGKGIMSFTGLDLRVANVPTFVPGTEPKRNHAMVTVICNRGTNDRTKEEMSDEITLNFWSKLADVACCFLYPGKQINIKGRLQSWTEDSGTLKADGSHKLFRHIEVVVDDIQLLSDSMKSLNERMAINLMHLKESGRIPQEVQFSAEELLAPHHSPMTEFNAAIASVTGKHGYARVWSKGVNFWDQNLGKLAAVTPAVTVQPSIENSTPEQIRAYIASLESVLDAKEKTATTEEVEPELVNEDEGADNNTQSVEMGATNAEEEVDVFGG